MALHLPVPRPPMVLLASQAGRSLPVRDLWVIAGCGLGVVLGLAATADASINFETAPVHPLDLSPDHGVLALANLPAARVEFFAVDEDPPRWNASVPVGLDPTTVRFRTSDSVSIVDLRARRVVVTIPTLDAPADVVFTGSPVRAFVSCTTANTLQVFDSESRAETGRVRLPGERPTALAVSLEGLTVYAAYRESGNASTLLAPRLGELNHPQTGGPADFPDGPHGGVNPHRMWEPSGCPRSPRISPRRRGCR